MIETLATIIAVAAWCGQPVVYDLHTEVNSALQWTTKDVDRCREEIFKCLKERPRDTKCFTEEKLDK